MKTIPYSEVSKLVREIDSLNDALKYIEDSNAVVVYNTTNSTINGGMQLKGKNAEIARFALIREFTLRRDNLVDQINGRAINTSA